MPLIKPAAALHVYDASGIASAFAVALVVQCGTGCNLSVLPYEAGASHRLQLIADPG